MRVELRRPSLSDEQEFLALVRRNRRFHRPWVYPPGTAEAFRAYLTRLRAPSRAGFLVCRKSDGAIVGVVGLNEIVRSSLQSAYLGYYGFQPHAAQGYMSEGIRSLLYEAFREMKLHRIEANIQPGNERSRTLVMRLGFRLEGYSPSYLKIGGRWRDHERWALLGKEWQRHFGSSQESTDT